MIRVSAREKWLSSAARRAKLATMKSSRTVLLLLSLTLLAACASKGEETTKAPENQAVAGDIRASPSTPADKPPSTSPPAAPEARPGEIPAPPDVAAPPTDAQKTASGLSSKVLQPGTGSEHPRAWDRVKVHYTGWTTDGKMFDSSVTRGSPATFPLNRVIPGWTEGLQLMVEGEKRRLWIPEELAYKGKPNAPQGMLVFDVELLSILD